MKLKLLTVALSASLLASPAANAIQADVNVFFSPNGGAREAILHNIDEAKKSIRVLAYLFTDSKIAEALIKAHKKGVDVQIILDKKMLTIAKNKGLETRKAGIPTYIDSAHATAHNKVIIIDNDKVITGSYNYIVKAETKNTENLVVIQSEEINKLYTNEWNKHPSHSVLLEDTMMKDEPEEEE